MSIKKSKIIIICGPSGVGKGSLISLLLTDFPQLVIPPSYTTRPQRPTESIVNKYHFVSQTEFSQAQKMGKILESVNEHGWQYGTDKVAINKILKENQIVLLEIETRGAKFIKNKYPENSTTIFIAPENLSTLKKRIINDHKRGEITQGELDSRLKTAKREMEFQPKSDYVIYNRQGKLNLAYQQLKSIIANLIQF